MIGAGSGRALLALVLWAELGELGCAEPTFFLEPPAGAKSAIVSVVAANGAEEVLALDLGQATRAPSAKALGSGDRIVVIFFAFGLADLQVRAGPILGTGQRPLPCDRRGAVEAVVRDRDLGPWTAVDRLPPGLERPLPPLDPIACLAAKRCPASLPCSGGIAELCLDRCTPVMLSTAAVGKAELASMEPCPEGWQKGQGPLGSTVCQPGRLDPDRCSKGQAPFLSSGCGRIGASPCPSDQELFGAAPAEAIFVRPPTPPDPGADGTRNRPLTSIALAMRWPSRSATIALARGRYEELVQLEGGRLLVGACPEETVLSGGIIAEPGATGGVAELTLTADRIALDIRGARVSARNARISAPSAAIRVAGGEVRASSCDLESAQDPVVDLGGGARAVFARAVVRRGAGRGITVASSTLTASDLVIAGQPASAGGAIEASGRGLVELRGAAVLGGKGCGVATDRSRLDADLLHIEGTSGPGVCLSGGMRHRLDRARIRGAGDFGVDLRLGGQLDQAKNLIVSELRRAEAGDPSGVELSEGAAFNGGPLVIDGPTIGLHLVGDNGGPSARVQDAVIRTALPFSIYPSGVIEVRRARLWGIGAILDGSVREPIGTLVLEDIYASDVVPLGALPPGPMIRVAKFARLKMSRAFLDLPDRELLEIRDSGHVEIQDLVARGGKGANGVVMRSADRTTEISSFRLEGYATALSLGENVELARLADGVIEGATCGLEILKAANIQQVAGVVIQGTANNICH